MKKSANHIYVTNHTYDTNHTILFSVWGVITASDDFAWHAGAHVLEEGVDRFELDHKITVACTIDKNNPHLVETQTVYTSEKRKGKTFVFCPKHKDYFDITYKP